MPSAYRPPFAAKTHSYSSFFFCGENCNFPFIYSGAVCCRDAQQTTLKFLFRPEFSDLKLENTAKWKNENKLIFRYSGTGRSKPPVFFWSATNNSQISKWIFTKTNFQSFLIHLLTDYFESSVTAATLLPVTAYWCCGRGKAHALESLARDYLYFEIFMIKDKSISNLYLISL